MMYNLSESHVSSNSAGTTGTNTSVPRKCLCQFIIDNNYHVEASTAGGELMNGTAATAGAGATFTASSSSNTLRCPVCVQKSLKPYKERHAQAVIDHAQAKKACARALHTNDHHQRLSALQAESQQLRDRLETMRKECSEMAVRVATQAIENDRHRENTTLGRDIEMQQLHLARFEQELLQGSMSHAIGVATSQVRALRFQWARKALAMHRLDIDLEDVKLTQLQRRRQEKQPDQIIQKQARGIGKIGGLPLPHAGPELYGVLPPRELQSALRLVASVTCTVARCLGIVLPHTILLTPNGPVGDIADTVSDGAVKQKANNANISNNGSSRTDDKQQQRDQPVGSSSTASLYSLMDGSYWKQSAKKVAKSALARATGHVTERPVEPATVTPPSLDTSQVSRRLHHATAAVIAEDQNPMSSKYALSAEGMNQQDFAIALQLLQNDVIVLCIRAGVPVAKLWPAEAMLLNLHALDAYIQQQISVSF